MTSQTSLPFGSITKTATAALAMRLVEQGRLELDDRIDRWYEPWRGDSAATVRDLLGHRAGVGEPPDAFFERFGTQGAPTTRQYIAATPKPGHRTSSAEYSNTGFMIAGLILARAGGRPIAAAMRQELFAHPSGDNLAFQPAEHPHRPLAHGYWYPEGAGEPVDASDSSPLLPNRDGATVASTAGALAGDVPSLARWAHELLGGKILEPESLREMTRFHDSAFSEGYGLGLARSTEGEHQLWGHEGRILGTSTDLWHLPGENLTIAIAWNEELLSGPEAGFVRVLLRAAMGSES